MSTNTTIEWCDHTFNPWEGCQKVSPGCDICYAEARNARFAGGTAINWGPGAPRRRTSAANWNLPKRWNAQADAFMAQHGRRQRVFCASLADVFDNAVDPQWRIDLFKLIHATPNLDWLLLTKRAGNAMPMIESALASLCKDAEVGAHVYFDVWPWPNVWIGATIVNQTEADRDIPKLLAVPAAKHFLSMEPLLGPVRLDMLCAPADRVMGNALTGKGGIGAETDFDFDKGIDWVIVGGESGPNARPMHPDWPRNLRDQCQAAGVPFLFKQWGNWRAAAWFDGPDADADSDDDFVDLDRTEHLFVAKDGRTWDTLGGRLMYPPLPLGHWCLMVNEGKKAAGRLLDGRTWDGFPS